MPPGGMLHAVQCCGLLGLAAALAIEVDRKRETWPVLSEGQAAMGAEDETSELVCLGDGSGCREREELDSETTAPPAALLEQQSSGGGGILKALMVAASAAFTALMGLCAWAGAELYKLYRAFTRAQRSCYILVHVHSVEFHVKGKSRDDKAKFVSVVTGDNKKKAPKSSAPDADGHVFGGKTRAVAETPACFSESIVVYFTKPRPYLHVQLFQHQEGLGEAVFGSKCLGRAVVDLAEEVMSQDHAPLEKTYRCRKDNEVVGEVRLSFFVEPDEYAEDDEIHHVSMKRYVGQAAPGLGLFCALRGAQQRLHMRNAHFHGKADRQWPADLVHTCAMLLTGNWALQDSGRRKLTFFEVQKKEVKGEVGAVGADVRAHWFLVWYDAPHYGAWGTHASEKHRKGYLPFSTITDVFEDQEENSTWVCLSYIGKDGKKTITMMGPDLEAEKFKDSVRSREELLQGLRIFRDLLSGAEANVAVPDVEGEPEGANAEAKSDSGTDDEGYDMKRRPPKPDADRSDSDSEGGKSSVASRKSSARGHTGGTR